MNLSSDEIDEIMCSLVEKNYLTFASVDKDEKSIYVVAGNILLVFFEDHVNFHQSAFPDLQFVLIKLQDIVGRLLKSLRGFVIEYVMLIVFVIILL